MLSYPHVCPSILIRLLSNDIARAAGLVFDRCWRSDDTVMGSEFCPTNKKIQVAIRGL
jgi:hypothetical protein